ncbi:AMP-binding protein [Marinospirillum sp. MEB164]|uniref:AMP-binding protein n=1 Tax=Marinospirillum alkalitolerans TaxID=3123374 RepID=A0ABW8PVX3_9GAMM
MIPQEVSSTELLTQPLVLAVIQSLVAAELKSLRPQQANQIFAEDWSAATQLQSRPGASADLCLQVDSIERMALATALVDFFQLAESGLEDYLLRWNTLGQWADLVIEARRRGSQDLHFLTSGTAGEPKVCAHAWPQLVEEVRFFAAEFERQMPGPPQRLLALSPCHHIYGFLFSVLLAAHWQVPVVRGQAAFFAVQARRLKAGDVLVGYPLVWKHLARNQQPFPPGVLGLTSTAPCDPLLIHQLLNQGLGQMIEIYGSSETAGVGWRCHPEQPFELLPRWEASAQPHQLVDHHTQQQQQLSDALEWQDARHFYPRGRLDAAVQVAGVNVFPQRIARQLAALPGVHQAQVRLMQPHEGERLKAFIVLNQPEQQAEMLVKLQAYCADHLSPPERPVAFTFGTSCPVNALGKPSDWPISSSAEWINS